MTRATVKTESVMDPTAWRLSGVYASALLDLIEDDQGGEDAWHELCQIVGLMDEVEGFEDMLAAWPLGRADRVEIVRRVFGGRVSDRIEGLLSVMAANERLELLRQVAAQFRELLNDREGKIAATVTTASPLDESAMAEIAAALRKMLSAEPVVRNKVDPRVLGGMVLKVGDRVYDATIATELNRIKRRLIQRSQQSKAPPEEPPKS